MKVRIGFDVGFSFQKYAILKNNLTAWLFDDKNDESCILLCSSSISEAKGNKDKFP
jgi:hypothetical protein